MKPNTIETTDIGKRIYFVWRRLRSLYHDVAEVILSKNNKEVFSIRKAGSRWYIFNFFDADEKVTRTISVNFKTEEYFEEIDGIRTSLTFDELKTLIIIVPDFDEIINENEEYYPTYFHTGIHIMKHQNSEWTELTDDLNDTIESLKSQITSIPKFSISVVDVLPTEDISETTVYLVKDSETDGNLYTEYVYINNVWEKLGTQTLDLEDYAKTEDVYTKQEIDNKNFVTEEDLPNGGVYVGSGDMPDNCNLQIDPNGDAIVIPTKTSELENDSGFITNNKIELTTETATLQPNIYYSFGETITLTLEFSEGDPTKLNGYMFGFISGATPTVLTLPSNIKWGNDSEIVIESGKQYEVCIVNNIALWTAAAVEAVS